MNKAQELRFYIEALCVYDLKKDEVIASLLDLLQNINSERVLEKPVINPLQAMFQS